MSICPMDIEDRSVRIKGSSDATAVGLGTPNITVVHTDRRWSCGDCFRIWINSVQVRGSPVTHRKDIDVNPFVKEANDCSAGTPYKRSRSNRGAQPLKMGMTPIADCTVLKFGPDPSLHRRRCSSMGASFAIHNVTIAMIMSDSMDVPIDSSLHRTICGCRMCVNRLMNLWPSADVGCLIDALMYRRRSNTTFSGIFCDLVNHVRMVTCLVYGVTKTFDHRIGHLMAASRHVVETDVKPSKLF